MPSTFQATCYTCTCTCTCTYTYMIQVHVHVRIHVHIIHVHSYTCTYTCTYLHIHVRIHVHIYIYVRIHVCGCFSYCREVLQRHPLALDRVCMKAGPPAPRGSVGALEDVFVRHLIGPPWLCRNSSTTTQQLTPWGKRYAGARGW